MTTTVHEPTTAAVPPSPEPWWAKVLRVVGWLLISAGVVVGLFIVYLLWWTDRETAEAQVELVEEFNEFVVPDGATTTSPDIGDLAAIPVETAPLPPTDAPTAEDLDVDDDRDALADDDGDPLVAPTDPGDAYALIWFQRGERFVVTDGPLAAVEGVTLDHLRSGPGHYPTSVAAGQAGNAAFAGHRTTYGRPFHNLDQLEDGDTIHVLDNAGRHWVYDFLELEIVAPSDVWVVGDEAVPGVDHLLTLTSCHPRFSARQRIVAWAELRGAPATADGPDEAAIGAATGADGELPGEEPTAAASVAASSSRRQAVMS